MADFNDQEREELVQPQLREIAIGLGYAIGDIVDEGFEAGYRAALAVRWKAGYGAALAAREDTERPDQYEDSRIANAVADALDHYERIGLDPHHWIVGGRVVDILRGRTPPVRDTERPDATDDIEINEMARALLAEQMTREREEMLNLLERFRDLPENCAHHSSLRQRCRDEASTILRKNGRLTDA